MKNKLQNQLLFSLLLLSHFLIFSQNEPLKKIDSMLIDINKSTLTTNVLYERVTPLAMLNIFNDSINIANVNYFEQALSELYRASNKQKFVSVEQFRTQYTEKNNYNTTDIGILNASFNQVNYKESDNTLSSLKISNNKFEKKQNNLPEFKTKNVFIIAPLKKYLIGSTVTYHFDNSFLIQESNRNISSIITNFDTTTDYTIYENNNFTNSNINVSYATTGEKY